MRGSWLLLPVSLVMLLSMRHLHTRLGKICGSANWFWPDDFPALYCREDDGATHGNKSGQCVLEIGTGSGYQTQAVLAQLVKHVFSVERIKSLQYQARRRLQRLICIMYLPDMVMAGRDGRQRPFDAIIVTAAFVLCPMPYYISSRMVDGRLFLLASIARNYC